MIRGIDNNDNRNFKSLLGEPKMLFGLFDRLNTTSKIIYQY